MLAKDDKQSKVLLDYAPDDKTRDDMLTHTNYFGENALMLAKDDKQSKVLLDYISDDETRILIRYQIGVPPMKFNLLRFIENIKRKYVYKKHYLMQQAIKELQQRKIDYQAIQVMKSFDNK